MSRQGGDAGLHSLSTCGNEATARCRELVPRCASCGNAVSVQAVALRLKINPLICNNHTGFLTFRMVSTVCCGVWLELSSQKPIRGVVCINVSYKVSTVKPE